MTLATQLVVKDLPKVLKSIDAMNEARVKAGVNAAKIEGYRLMLLLRDEIRRGAPGGRTFAPLSHLARRVTGKTRQPINRTALRRLALGVKYDGIVENGRISVKVGFLSGIHVKRFNRKTGEQLFHVDGTAKIRNIHNTTWRRIAKNVQEGGTFPVTRYARLWGITYGAQLKKRKAPEAKYYFLRKSTKFFVQPSRPIIDPFWRAYSARIAGNIRYNWVIQMNKLNHRGAVQQSLMKGWLS